MKRANSEDDNLILNVCMLPAIANLKISDQDPTLYLPQLQNDLGKQAAQSLHPICFQNQVSFRTTRRRMTNS